ncbi:hypothetical protein M4951_18420 [Blastopirellula sp. J2-11]|uniref:hypothetical protein n=1 Tax=Blastopirellula sp. J2-11 TaxID=2943192 RepID=UPI0021C962D8|nr:hypothetical protein [Blastopirellula sp. J2-11]UUO05344.1 hypothetical protein M4951_18420 [Blastopirellula sp. J2-11]
MTSGFYAFLLVQLLIGAIVGKSVPMKFLGIGWAIAVLLGMAAIVELIVVSAQNLDQKDISIAPHTVSVLLFGFVVWSISILFTCIGYWLGVFVSRRAGLGGAQFGIRTLLAFVAIYAVVAAMGRMM